MKKILKCDNCGNYFEKYESSIYSENAFCKYDCYQEFRESNTSNVDFFEKIDTEEKAYWLGFIYADGDGGICYNKNNGKYSIQMIGRISFLEKIRDEIHYKVGLRKTKLTGRKNTNVVSILQWSGTKQLIVLKDWLYKDATVWLDRKRKQFEDIKIEQKIMVQNTEVFMLIKESMESHLHQAFIMMGNQ